MSEPGRLLPAIRRAERIALAWQDCAGCWQDLRRTGAYRALGAARRELRDALLLRQPPQPGARPSLTGAQALLALQANMTDPWDEDGVQAPHWPRSADLQHGGLLAV